jgi:hypothetical protein
MPLDREDLYGRHGRRVHGSRKTGRKSTRPNGYRLIDENLVRIKPSFRQRITNELIITKQGNSRIETRRDRVTGELVNTLVGNPSDAALRTHHNTIVAKWGYRKSWPDFIAEVLRLRLGLT